MTSRTVYQRAEHLYTRSAAGTFRCMRIQSSPLLLFTFLCIAFILSRPLGAADENQKIRNLVEKALAMHRAWGPKTSSPNTTLVLQESYRGSAGGQSIVKYRMLTTGLPTDKTYSLLSWPLNGQPTQALAGVTITEKGLAVCAGRPGTCGDASKPDDPIDLVLSGGQAEPKRIGLVSDDQSTKVLATVVPFPNRATDNNCTLEAILLTPNAEGVIVSASGLMPLAKLDILTWSEGEEQRQGAKSDTSGGYEMVLLPFKKGLTKGRAKVSIRSDRCSPSLTFDWGQGSYRLQ